MTQNLQKTRDRLLSSAKLWSVATDRTLGALSSVVVNHGSALARLADPSNAITDLQIEKFARFLVDPSNWPDGTSVPQEVIEFAHAVGITAPDASVSAGIADKTSRTPRGAGALQ